MKDACTLTFLEAKEEDLTIILELYNYYISNSTATFDWDHIDLDELKNRIFVNNNKYKTFLVYSNDEMIGFCFLTEFRSKQAYDFTVEVGLYLKPQYTGKGCGSEIIGYLEKVAIQNKFETIIASISGENTASIHLFKKLGYDQCSHYKKIAVKFGRKIDLIDFQKTLPSYT